MYELDCYYFVGELGACELGFVDVGVVETEGVYEVEEE